jgi:DNA-binding MarR family transcriptional regulator
MSTGLRTDLRTELQQKKPFGSIYQEAFLNIARTEAVLGDALARVLSPHGLSATQYNVLRMLRGAEPDGLCRNQIRDRLINRMPDVTRLLDRMEDATLIVRVRGEEDRRMVTTRLTKKGRSLVDELDDAVAAEHKRQLGHLTRDQLKTLIDLLTLARDTA